jgi:ubiquinone/menaquinone biosynthesis C-methylase UbiE
LASAAARLFGFGLREGGVPDCVIPSCGTKPEDNALAEITNFQQADTAPSFFVDFLDFLDKQDSIKRVRAESYKRLRLAAGSKVLDVGCGIGGATIPLAEITGPTGLVAGVDLSSELLKVARARAGARPGLEFKNSDACAIPYPDGFFDIARSERLFLYLPDRIGVAREMMRVVKSGGQVSLIDTELDCTAIYSKKPALTRKMTSIVAATMPNGNSARELPAVARQAGLKNIQIDTLAITAPHEFFLRAIAGSLTKAAEDGTVPAAEVEEFLAEQAALHASGNFLQLWFMVIVTASV